MEIINLVERKAPNYLGRQPCYIVLLLSTRPRTHLVHGPRLPLVYYVTSIILLVLCVS